MQLTEFNNKVDKLVQQIGGSSLICQNAKWWKIDTSIMHMLKQLFTYKTSHKTLVIKFDQAANRIYIDHDLKGMSISTFVQYFKIGYFFGCFEIIEELNTYRTARNFFQELNKFKFSRTFVEAQSIEDYLLALNLITSVQTYLQWLTPRSYMWEAFENLILTLAIYAIAEQNKSIETMIEYLTSHKQKDNTLLKGAISEFESQKQICSLLSSLTVEKETKYE